MILVSTEPLVRGQLRKSVDYDINSQYLQTAPFSVENHQLTVSVGIFMPQRCRAYAHILHKQMAVLLSFAWYPYCCRLSQDYWL